MDQISVQQLKTLQESGENWQVLDVRETWEYEICHIPDSKHIPMQDIPSMLDKLDQQANIAVLCHHGMRSLQVAAYLEREGFNHVVNVTGGIDAWASEIDSSMQRY